MALRTILCIVIILIVFGYVAHSDDIKNNLLSQELVVLLNGVKPQMKKDELTAHVKKCFASGTVLQGKEWSEKSENYFEYMLNENISFEVLGLRKTNDEGKTHLYVSDKPKVKVHFILTGVNISIDF